MKGEAGRLKIMKLHDLPIKVPLSYIKLLAGNGTTNQGGLGMGAYSVVRQ